MNNRNKIISYAKSEIKNLNEKGVLIQADYKKFAYELLIGWFPSHKFSEGVYQRRIVDKIKNKYEHLIMEYGSNKIDHYENEKLTDHFHKNK